MNYITEVDLNCSGTKFTISLDTLKKLPFFKSYIDRWHTTCDSSSGDTQRIVNNPLFIDQDPKLFRHVLNLVRHPGYIIPEKYVENVLMIADFYGMSVVLKNEPVVTPIVQYPRLKVYSESLWNHSHREIVTKGAKITNLIILAGDEFDTLVLNFYTKDDNRNPISVPPSAILFIKTIGRTQNRCFQSNVTYQVDPNYIHYIQGVHRIETYASLSKASLSKASGQIGEIMVYCES